MQTLLRLNRTGGFTAQIEVLSPCMMLRTRNTIEAWNNERVAAKSSIAPSQTHIHYLEEPTANICRSAESQAIPGNGKRKEAQAKGHSLTKSISQNRCCLQQFGPVALHCSHNALFAIAMLPFEPTYGGTCSCYEDAKGVLARGNRMVLGQSQQASHSTRRTSVAL